MSCGCFCSLAQTHAARTCGYTALLEAAFEGHVEVTRVLIEAGADMDQADNLGHAPMHIALRKKHRDVALLLLSRGASFPDTASFPDAIRLIEWLVAAATEREDRHAAEVARLRLEVQSLEYGIPHLLQAAMGHGGV